MVSSGRFQYPRNTFGPRTRISPASSSSASEPSTSIRRSSTPGSGRPTEPAFASFPTAFELTDGAASVSPYPSQIVMPNRARTPSMTSAGSAAAPDAASRTLLNASRGGSASSHA